MDIQAILRRVRKLLAIASDARGDANEAAAAATQAENLMRKFNIEHADLLREQLKAEGAMTTRRCNANMKRDDPKRTPLRRVPSWAGWIGVRVAQLNDCGVRYAFGPTGAMVEFCGLEMDVEVSAHMFDYIVNQLIIACRAFGASAPRGKAEMDSYRKGFAIAVASKLAALGRARAAEMNGGDSSRALVLAKSAAVAEHFGAEQFAYRQSSSIAPSDAEAARRGLADGLRLDVERRGLSSTPKDGQLALGR